MFDKARAPTYGGTKIIVPSGPLVTGEWQVRMAADALLAYRHHFKEMPDAITHEGIVSALLGFNADNFAFFPAENEIITPRGQWLDAWQTPLFFHLISSIKIEVRSAGPDRVMWNEDDICCDGTGTLHGHNTPTQG